MAMPGMSTALPSSGFEIIMLVVFFIQSGSDFYKATVISRFSDLHSKWFLSSYSLFHVSRCDLPLKHVSRT
jgi:hypothetical protein